MRTAIILGSVIIANSIKDISQLPDGMKVLIVLVTCVFTLMDFADFANRQ